MVSVFTRKVRVHSNSWNRPRPGHKPRLEPRKLRKSFQLNLSIDVLLTLTVLEKPKENPEMFEFLNDSNPSSTVTVVLRIESFRTVFYLKFFYLCFSEFSSLKHGIRQSEACSPVKIVAGRRTVENL